MNHTSITGSEYNDKASAYNWATRIRNDAKDTYIQARVEHSETRGSFGEVATRDAFDEAESNYYHAKVAYSKAKYEYEIAHASFYYGDDMSLNLD